MEALIVMEALSKHGDAYWNGGAYWNRPGALITMRRLLEWKRLQEWRCLLEQARGAYKNWALIGMEALMRMGALIGTVQGRL